MHAQGEGDIAGTIAGVQLTEASYFNSIALLMDWYGHPHKLKTAHMKALLNVWAPFEKLFSLQEFYGTVETHIHTLSS